MQHVRIEILFKKKNMEVQKTELPDCLERFPVVARHVHGSCVQIHSLSVSLWLTGFLQPHVYGAQCSCSWKRLGCATIPCDLTDWQMDIIPFLSGEKTDY